MTDEEKRIAIAEFCGWMPEPRGWYNNGLYQTVDSLPDFLNSLDDMHAAEETLTWDQQCRMHNFLCSTIPCTQMVWRSTARQRAEAFLKTIQQP